VLRSRPDTPTPEQFIAYLDLAVEQAGADREGVVDSYRLRHSRVQAEHAVARVLPCGAGVQEQPFAFRMYPLVTTVRSGSGNVAASSSRAEEVEPITARSGRVLPSHGRAVHPA